jgi:hypothetical protein
LGGGTLLKGGYGFTPLDDDLDYKPGPSKPTGNQKRAAARSKKVKLKFWKKKRKANPLQKKRSHAKRP